MMTREEAVQALDLVGDGVIDFAYSNGALRSSKEMFKSGDGFSVFHGIDGTMTWFTREQAIEVLAGERSAWDGETMEDDEFTCDDCGEDFDIEESIEVEDGIYICEHCAEMRGESLS